MTKHVTTGGEYRHEPKGTDLQVFRAWATAPDGLPRGFVGTGPQVLWWLSRVRHTADRRGYSAI